jgi:hypothetical protein
MPEEFARFFSDPDNLHACRDIFQGKVTIPHSGGIYAWYFKPGLLSWELKPEWVFSVGEEGLGLCYLGISPDREESSGNLNRRLWKHLKRTARNSTLRLSLGALLIDELGLQVKSHGKRKISFGNTEGKLTDWILRNGHVAWFRHEQPWEVEINLIHRFIPPLNLDDNPKNPFAEILEEKRAELKSQAGNDFPGQKRLF